MPTKPTCSSCRSYHSIDDTCHFSPPQTSIVMVPSPEMTSFSPQTFCAFPTTQKHEWCSQWGEKSRIITPTI